jgi:DNA-directed RNA polymerase subunit H
LLFNAIVWWDLLSEIDILKHKLVPKHEILSEREKEELLAKYGITLKQLPRIFSTDPVVKLIGAKVGDVIKITRKDDVFGKSIYYRVVIKG